MFFTRNFHLKPLINYYVRTVLESGLLNKWEGEDQKLIGTDLSGSRSADGTQSSYTVLTLDHVQGAFYIGFIGFGFAVISFIVEIMVFNYRLYSNRWKTLRFLWEEVKKTKSSEKR